MLCNLFLILFIPIIIISIIYIICYLSKLFISVCFFSNLSYLKYTINDKSFSVIKDKDNYENAAEVLYTIDNNLIRLINYITKKYHNTENTNGIDPKKLQHIHNIIYKLQKNYKSHSLIENFPSVPGKDVSFNINKGDHISLCLRDFKNPKDFHEINDILFVAIHELAHSCSKSYGHDDEFWYNFRFLLENAIELKIFNNINYNKYPVNYCSMNISYNPIFDASFDDKNYFKLT